MILKKDSQEKCHIKGKHTDYDDDFFLISEQKKKILFLQNLPTHPTTEKNRQFAKEKVKSLMNWTKTLKVIKTPTPPPNLIITNCYDYYTLF